MTARLLDAACKDVLPLLDAAADGELLDEDRAVVRAHLSTCTACRSRMDATQSVKAALRAAAASQEELPVGFEERVRGALGVERELRARQRARTTARWMVGAAAICCTIAFGAWLATPAQVAAPPFAPDEPTVATLVDRHALDVPVDVASPDPARLSSFLAPRLGSAVVVPRLDAAGFGLLGARVVDVADGRGAQLVYRGGLDERLTLIMLPDRTGAVSRKLLGAMPAASLDRAGHRLRVWKSDGGVRALVGAMPGERLDRIAAAIER